MANGVTANFEYGVLSLICDEETLAHLRNLICTEAAVADAIGSVRVDTSGMRSISIDLPPPPSDSQPSGSR